MLSNNEINIIKKLVLKQKGSLKQIQEQYLSTFKQTISILNACSFLSELIVTQDLLFTQRIVSLYLLLTSYGDCQPENHPFVIDILNFSQTIGPFERTMIYEILIKGNHSKVHHYLTQYLNLQLESLNENTHRQKPSIEEDKQIHQLKQIIEEKVIKAKYLDKQDQDCATQFLRLVPEYIPISISQLNWLSPGIISDVQWDNSAQIDKKLQKSRKIFESSLKRSLDTQQRSELMNSIDSDPYTALHIGFNVKDLQELITYNSFIASLLVIKISKYPNFKSYLEQYLCLPTTISLLDSMARIIKQVKVPQSYISFFCSHHMYKMIKSKESTQNFRTLVYAMTAFLRCMIENEIIEIFQIEQQMKEFMAEFNGLIDFGGFKMLLAKQNQLQ